MCSVEFTFCNCLHMQISMNVKFTAHAVKTVSIQKEVTYVNVNQAII